MMSTHSGPAAVRRRPRAVLTLLVLGILAGVSASVVQPPVYAATTQLLVILFGVGVLALGCVVFLLWSWRTSRWPFGLAQATS